MSAQKDAAHMTGVGSTPLPVIWVTLPLSIEHLPHRLSWLTPLSKMMAENPEYISHPSMGRSRPKVDDASELLEFLW